jgi:hypothetical protein
MDPTWTFNEMTPGQKAREAMQGEFFSTEVIRTAAGALVREGIQNALDAAPDSPTGAVRVRIFISGDEGALDPGRHNKYFKGAWPHIEAPENSLTDLPSPDDACHFLTFEDFGTKGLNGDPRQWHDIHEQENDFYYFFHAEGRSGKGESDRGRWGVGKFVFPRSSRIKTFFGFTVQSEGGRRLLMGEATLRSHMLNGKPYTPDGWFAEMNRKGHAMPFTRDDLISQFCEDFCLKRETESGLSLVVPFCDSEMTKESLIEAVVQDYFYPILTGELIVTLADPASEILLDAGSIESAIPLLEESQQHEYGAVIELTKWACSQDGTSIPRTAVPPPDGALNWYEELIPTDLLKQIRESLDLGDRIAVRVPVTVRKKDETPKGSFFDIYMVRDEHAHKGQPVFIREGIIISDVRPPRSRGVRSLVVVAEGPLATLLGDSENPAHTQWQSSSAKFKGRYSYGPSYIRFVVRSVAEIVNIASDNERDEDRNVLVDLFSLPVEVEEAPRVQVETPEPKLPDIRPDVTPPSPTPLPPSPSRYRVRQVDGGFTVSRGDRNEDRPKFLDIRVAYDRRTGNPFRKYSELDFRLNQAPIAMSPDPTGIELVKVGGNRLVARVMTDDFLITVRGFDARRDVIVDVRVREEFDAA